MKQLRRYFPEVGFLLLALLWMATTAEGPGAANSLGNVGVSLGGLALLIRAITPLLRPRHDNGSDREDIRWQEQTSAAIESLAKSIAAMAEETRRHNTAVEVLLTRRAVDGLELS
ncbi:MAG TPA: hypothetical protein PK308_00140 [Phycisphaerales bacterium]|nr:hypothetical protein [Phycisphaerales bacterium]